MKKKIIISFVMVVLLVFTAPIVAACTQKEDPSTIQVNNVIALIDRIPDPLPEKLEDYTNVVREMIKSARDAYNKLSDTLKLNVTNYDKLVVAEATLSALEDTASAQEVIDMIAKIPAINKLKYSDVASFIKPASTAFNKLTDARKALVTNKAHLEDAVVMQGHLEKVEKCAVNIRALTADNITTESVKAIDDVLDEILSQPDQKTIWTTYYKKESETLESMRVVLADKLERKYEANVSAIQDIITAISNTLTADMITYCSKAGIENAQALIDAADKKLSAFAKLTDQELNTVYAPKKEAYLSSLAQLETAKEALARNKLALNGSTIVTPRVYGAVDVLNLFDSIKKLGTVADTNDFKTKLNSCMATYNALTSFLQEKVENADILFQKNAELELILEYKAAADRIIAAINNIGVVSLSAEDKILFARNLYDHPVNANGVEYSFEDAEKIRAIVVSENKLTTLTNAEAALLKAKKEEADKQAAQSMASNITALCQEAVTLANYNDRKAQYDIFMEAYSDRETFTADMLASLQKNYASAINSLNTFKRKLDITGKVYVVNVMLIDLGHLNITLASETFINEVKAEYDKVINDNDYPNAKNSNSYAYFSKEQKDLFEGNYALYYTTAKQELDVLKARNKMKNDFINSVKTVLTTLGFSGNAEETPKEDIVALYTAQIHSTALSNQISNALKLLNGDSTNSTADGIMEYDGLISEVEAWSGLIIALNEKKTTYLTNAQRDSAIISALSSLKSKDLNDIRQYDVIKNLTEQITALCNAYISAEVGGITQLELEGKFSDYNAVYIPALQAVSDLEETINELISLAGEMGALPQTTTLTKDTPIAEYNSVTANYNSIKDRYNALPSEQKSYITTNYKSSYDRYTALASRFTYLKPLRDFLTTFNALGVSSDEDIKISHKTNVQILKSMYLTTLNSSQQSEVASYNAQIDLYLKMIEFLELEASHLSEIQSFIITAYLNLPASLGALQISDEANLKSYETQLSAKLSIYTAVRYKNMTYETRWASSGTANDLENLKIYIQDLRTQMGVIVKAKEDSDAVSTVAKMIFDIPLSYISYKSSYLSSAKASLKAAQDAYNALSEDRKTNFADYCVQTYKETTFAVHGAYAGIYILTWMSDMTNMIAQEEVKLQNKNIAVAWAERVKQLPSMTKADPTNTAHYTTEVAIQIVGIRNDFIAGSNDWKQYVNQSELGFDAIGKLELAEYMVLAKECNDEALTLYNESINVLRSKVPELLAKIQFALSEDGKYAKLDASVKTTTIVTHYPKLTEALATVQEKNIFYSEVDAVDALIQIVIDLGIPETFTNNDMKQAILTAYNAYSQLKSGQIAYLSLNYATTIVNAYASFNVYETALINSFKQRVNALGATAEISEQAVIDELIAEYEDEFGKYDSSQKLLLKASYDKLIQFRQDISNQITSNAAAFNAMVDACPSPESYDYKVHESTVTSMLAYYDSVNASEALAILGQANVTKVEGLKISLLKGKVQRVADAYLNLVSGDKTSFTSTHISALNSANSLYDSTYANATYEPYFTDASFTAAWDLKSYYNMRMPQVQAREAVISLINSIPSTVTLDAHATLVENAEVEYNAVCNENNIDKNILQAMDLLSKINTAKAQLETQKQVAYDLASEISSITLAEVVISTAYKNAFNSLKSRFNALSSAQKALIADLGIQSKLDDINLDIQNQEAYYTSIKSLLISVPSAADVSLDPAKGHKEKLDATTDTLDGLRLKLYNDYGDVSELKYNEFMAKLTIDLDYEKFLNAKAVYEGKLQKVADMEAVIDALHVLMGGTPESSTLVFVLRYKFVADYLSALNAYNALASDEKSAVRTDMRTFLINNQAAMNTLKQTAENFMSAVAAREVPLSWINYGKALIVVNAYNSMSADLKTEFQDAYLSVADSALKTAWGDYLIYKADYEAFETEKINNIVNKIRELDAKRQAGTIEISDRTLANEIEALYAELSMYPDLRLRVECGSEYLYTNVFKSSILSAIAQTEQAGGVFTLIDTYYNLFTQNKLTYSHSASITSVRGQFNNLSSDAKLSVEGQAQNAKLLECEAWMTTLLPVSNLTSKVNLLYAKVEQRTFTLADETTLSECATLLAIIEANSIIEPFLELDTRNKLKDCETKLDTLSAARGIKNRIYQLELIGKTGLQITHKTEIDSIIADYNSLSAIQVLGEFTANVNTTVAEQRNSITNYTFVEEAKIIVEQLNLAIQLDVDISNQYQQISTLDEATYSVWDNAVRDLRSRYNSYNPTVQAKVANIQLLKDMETAVSNYNKLLIFKSQIIALATPYADGSMNVADHEASIKVARATYDGLAANIKVNQIAVDNLVELEKYESRIASLKKAASMNTRIAPLYAKATNGTILLSDEEAYNTLLNDYNDLATSDPYAHTRVEGAKITFIGNKINDYKDTLVNNVKQSIASLDARLSQGLLRLLDEEDVKAAQTAYYALTLELQMRITANEWTVLNTCVEKIAQMKQAKEYADLVEEFITNVSTAGTKDAKNLTLMQKTYVQSLRTLYNNLTSAVKAYVQSDYLAQYQWLQQLERRIEDLETIKKFQDDVVALLPSGWTVENLNTMDVLGNPSHAADYTAICTKLSLIDAYFWTMPNALRTEIAESSTSKTAYDKYIAVKGIIATLSQGI